MRRLAKVERSIQEKLKKQAKRYNKFMWIPNGCHCSKGGGPPINPIICLLPFATSRANCTSPFCRTELHKSAAEFFEWQVIKPCSHQIDCIYSDNGSEYKGAANHPFGVTCFENGINQKFTRPARPQTNGKAERVIRTIMEMWHDKQQFDSPEHRQTDTGKV